VLCEVGKMVTLVLCTVVKLEVVTVCKENGCL